MSEPLEIEYSPLTIRIADDQAWYYHALIVTLLRQRTAPRVFVRGEGINIESAIGFATTTRNDDGTTDITIVPDMGAEEAWQLIRIQVRRFAAEAANRRKQMTGMTADEVIERYYRARAAGHKVTLKQLAAQAGFSYSHITKAKMKYDRAGKWGSRAKEIVKPENDI